MNPHARSPPPPPRDAENPAPPPPERPSSAAQSPANRAAREDPPPPAAIVNRAAREDPPAARKVERGIGGEGAAAARGPRGVGWILRRERTAAAVRTAEVGVRAAALVLCLVAFSVMAADKHKGWALDSYDHYAEYRYVVAVNVIGFLYSGFQVYAHVQHTLSGKHMIGRPTGYYFDFGMDQIMAYLLISASSSATARTDDWVANYGKDAFPSMATGSVAMSFLAFMAFALCSLISAYNLFTWNL